MDIKEYLEGFRKVKIAANRQLDRYYINKYGVIIALKRRTLQILKPKLADNGYYCVGLRDETGESIVNIRMYLIESVCSKV